MPRKKQDEGSTPRAGLRAEFLDVKAMHETMTWLIDRKKQYFDGIKDIFWSSDCPTLAPGMVCRSSP